MFELSLKWDSPQAQDQKPIKHGLPSQACLNDSGFQISY